MQSDAMQTTDVDRLTALARPLRDGIAKEIEMQERVLMALRAKLTGVDMVIAACQRMESGG